MKVRNRSFDTLLNFSGLSAHRNAIYGFAALWIVFFHYTDMGMKVAGFSPKLRFLWDTFQLGNIGVDIFLFLSGIGLYYSFSKDSRVLRFYYKRLIRVLVPFVLLCIPYMIYLTATGAISFGSFVQKATTIYYWTGETKRLDLWYVPVILALYLLYPLIYKFIFRKEKNALGRCALLIGISIVLTMTLWAIPATRDFYYRFDKFLPRIAPFLLGCYCGKPVKEKKDFSAWVIVGAITVVFFAYPLYARGILYGPFYRYYGSLTGVAMVFLLAQLFELVKSIRVDRFFAFFGGFSLEIYLLHIEARNWYMHSAHFGEHPLKYYTLLALGALVVGYLASLVEKPIVRQLMKPLQENKK